MRDAWRSFSGQSWTGLLGEDRERRGPVEGDEPAPARGAARAAPVETPPGPGEESQYGDFMGKVARTPARAARHPDDS